VELKMVTMVGAYALQTTLQSVPRSGQSQSLMHILACAFPPRTVHQKVVCALELVRLKEAFHADDQLAFQTTWKTAKKICMSTARSRKRTFKVIDTCFSLLRTFKIAAQAPTDRAYHAENTVVCDDPRSIARSSPLAGRVTPCEASFSRVCRQSPLL
jgi:hypothetical protein